MRILALDPYYGGSHKAFLDGWCAHSRHTWTILGLPAYKWKWRMRHGAITFAQQVGDLSRGGSSWDLLFCSDMLNLAEFIGLSPAAVQRLPSVAYFHENQLTYPVRHESERDYHFALTNMTTALAATQVWFNSAFHREGFLGAIPGFLRRMPDQQPFAAVEVIRAKSAVRPPGIAEFPQRGSRPPGPLRILWAARWEHDKNPQEFFDALEAMQANGTDFRVSVIGQSFRETPEVFAVARRQFADHIDRWGYLKSRQDYEAALAEADVVVSTANHEFFGISVVEAIAAGAYPVLPRRLAYPEILAGIDGSPDDFLYEGGAALLVERLTLLAERAERNDLWAGDAARGARAMTRFSWEQLAPRIDEALDALTG